MDSYCVDSHKLYWHLGRVLKWQQGRMIAPIYLEVSPVSYCNHHCIFCAKDFAMGNKRLEIKHYVSRLKEMGALGVKSIMYAGEGEPLLHPDLHKMIEETKKNKMDVALTTNGVLADKTVWKRILPFLTWVKFSLDAGSADVYSKVHGTRRHQFEKALNSIQMAMSVREELKMAVTIGVQYLLVEENYHDVFNAMRLCHELKVDYLILKAYSRNPKMINNKEVTYSEAFIDTIDAQIKTFSQHSGLNIIFRKESLRTYQKKSIKYSHCNALPFWGYICASGDYYSCSIYIGDKKFCNGNIYEQSMQSILLGDSRNQTIRFAENELQIQEKCRVNCRMARINEFLEMIKSPPQHINFI